VNSDDEDLNGTTITVRLEGESTSSGDTEAVIFKIEFKDVCQGNLIPPTPIDHQPFEFELYTEEVYRFTYALSSFNVNCIGSLTYTLVDADTDEQITDGFTLGEGGNLEFIGNPLEKTWADDSPHQFKIVVSASSTGLPLGMSDPFTVNVVDPCNETIITPQSISNILIDFGDQKTINLEQFTDSVSLEHG
jgi:hypothetical protein